MAISKVSGTAWADVAKVDGISAAGIAGVAGVDVPAGTPTLVTDNLFLHYDAEFVSGSSVLDQSGNGYNLTMANGAYVGTYQGVSTFITDGVNDRIDGQVPQADMSSIDYPVTLESWHYYGSNFGHLSAFVINDAPDTVDWFRQHVDSRSGTGQNNRTWEQVYSASGQRYTMVMVTNAFALNGWKCITTTIERTGATGGRHLVRHYINGVFAGQRDISNATYYDNPFYTQVPWSEGTGNINVSIGCLIRSSVSYYPGRTSEARFYADKLSDAEILQNFIAKKAKHGIT